MTATANATSYPSLLTGTYLVDPARTTVRFSMREMFGLMGVEGEFAVRDGTIVVADDPRMSSVGVELDPASFKTDRARRDRDIKGKRFLDVEAFPAMTFASTAVEPTIDGWTLSGKLTVHGVTAPVTLRLTGGRRTPDGLRVTAACVVDRTDFGVGPTVPLIGKVLTIDIEVCATLA
jgi:polyisoprenoid-binding protein YceI